MHLLNFIFFRLIKAIEVNPSLRVSIWFEDDDSYLMPCQFKQVEEGDNFYSIKIEVLDPNRVISKRHLDKKCLFGHPNKIIGYGILKEIEVSC